MKRGGCCAPFADRWDNVQYNVASAEVYFRTKWRVHPFSHWAPIFGPFLSRRTAGCIKMPLIMEVGLSPDDHVLDWDPVPLRKKGWSPQMFVPRILLSNGCMYQDAAWYRGRRRPTRHCVRWGPSSPPLKGHSPPIFGHCPLRPNGWID